MKLRFEGQTHSIDANTLINMLIHYRNVVSLANTELSGGSREVDIKINALEKGSFVVDISLIQNVFETLFSKETVTYIGSLTAVVCGVYKIYKHIKGKPVTDESEIKEIGVKNNIDITISVYNNKVVREAISKSFEMLNQDPNVEGLSIKGEDEMPTVSFERCEFADCIYNDFENESDGKGTRIIEEEATIQIISLSFESKTPWRVIYNGNTIKVSEHDEALMQIVNKGTRFGKGDRLRVKLRIVQQYSKEYEAYANQRYKVVECLEFLPRKEEPILFRDL